MEKLRYDDLPVGSDDNFEAVSKWKKRPVSFGFLNGTPDIAGEDEWQAVREGFAIWSASAPIKFVEVEGAAADIKISWGAGDHGDGFPFDGVGVTLAHAFFPTDGRIHFDDAEAWTTSFRATGGQPIDLVTVAAHEIGHAIGLGHSTDVNALMHPFYLKSHRFLGVDDLNGAVALYGPEGRWFLRNSNTAGAADVDFIYGGPGIPSFGGDWNADGVDTPGIYVPATGSWHLRNSNTAGGGDINFIYGGGAGTLPIVGDWNEDGIDTAGIYVPATGSWHLRNSNTAGGGDINFIYGGGAGTLPIVGDWNEDGIDTAGIYVPATGSWHLRNSNTAGGGDINFIYGGGAGTLPIVGDWNEDGIDTAGIYNPVNCMYHLRNTNTAGAGEINFCFGGEADSRAIAGDWDGDGVDTIGMVR